MTKTRRDGISLALLGCYPPNMFRVRPEELIALLRKSPPKYGGIYATSYALGEGASDDPAALDPKRFASAPRSDIWPLVEIFLPSR